MNIENRVKHGCQLERLPSIGSFSLDNNPFRWIKCRENFSSEYYTQSNNKSVFFYSINHVHIENIADFIYRFENNVKTEVRTIFCKTNYKFACYIQPDKYWCNNPIRHSLFTLLLRCSLKHTYRNDIFSTMSYTIKNKKIISSISKFIEGGFYYKKDYKSVGLNKGWVDYVNKHSFEILEKK